MDFNRWLRTQKHTTECPCCERMRGDVERRRMSTQYEDEESNWEETCEECYLDHEEHWKQMWAEYYAGCLY